MALLSVRVEGSDLERLDAAAKENGVSRSDILRLLISERTPGPGVAWIAYYSDMSGCVPFGDEISALRYAVEHHMEVIRVPFGISLDSAINAKADEMERR